VGALAAHRGLETYRVPRRLVGMQTEFGPVPPRFAPIFRDRDELATATSLGATLVAALEQSACQIVICSRKAAQSRWVNGEILTFKRQGKSHRIFSLVVDGEPGVQFRDTFIAEFDVPILEGVTESLGCLPDPGDLIVWDIMTIVSELYRSTDADGDGLADYVDTLTNVGCINPSGTEQVRLSLLPYNLEVSPDTYGPTILSANESVTTGNDAVFARLVQSLYDDLEFVRRERPAADLGLDLQHAGEQVAERQDQARQVHQRGIPAEAERDRRELPVVRLAADELPLLDTGDHADARHREPDRRTQDAGRRHSPRVRHAPAAFNAGERLLPRKGFRRQPADLPVSLAVVAGRSANGTRPGVSGVRRPWQVP
jgi:hypothetical protein